jgi:hypothetical protein
MHARGHRARNVCQQQPVNELENEFIQRLPGFQEWFRGFIGGGDGAREDYFLPHTVLCLIQE